jgi:tRNA pseudouridine13 synthase
VSAISWIKDANPEWPDYLQEEPVPETFQLSDELTIDGTVKESPEDYHVTEILDNPPEGNGPNTFIRVQKTNIGTLEVIQILGEFLDRDTEDFCVADYKDSQSVAIQWISLEHLDPRALDTFQHENIEIIKITRNPEKLKPVDLDGNRFEITLRDVSEGGVDNVREGLNVLQERGVPNWYSRRIFGYRNNQHLLGWALIKKKWDWFLNELLNSPKDADSNRLKTARNSAKEGDWKRALERFPEEFRAEREALSSLSRYPDNQERSVEVIPKIYRQLYMNGFQAFAFNKFLDQRFDRYDELVEGDVAYMHDTAGCFPVMEPKDEQPRLDRFEISPTGPLFGEKSLGASEAVGSLEDEILENCELEYGDFQRCRYPIQGRRRPLRVPISQISVQALEDDDLEVGFFLPRNSYASSVLEELLHRRLNFRQSF